MFHCVSQFCMLLFVFIYLNWFVCVFLCYQLFVFAFFVVIQFLYCYVCHQFSFILFIWMFASFLCCPQLLVVVICFLCVISCVRFCVICLFISSHIPSLKKIMFGVTRWDIFCCFTLFRYELAEFMNSPVSEPCQGIPPRDPECNSPARHRCQGITDRGPILDSLGISRAPMIVILGIPILSDFACRGPNLFPQEFPGSPRRIPRIFPARSMLLGIPRCHFPGIPRVPRLSNDSLSIAFYLSFFILPSCVVLLTVKDSHPADVLPRHLI